MSEQNRIKLNYVAIPPRPPRKPGRAKTIALQSLACSIPLIIMIIVAFCLMLGT